MSLVLTEWEVGWALELVWPLKFKKNLFVIQEIAPQFLSCPAHDWVSNAACTILALSKIQITTYFRHFYLQYEM
jgi:hypothetical protein